MFSLLIKSTILIVDLKNTIRILSALDYLKLKAIELSCSSAYLLPGGITSRQQAARWEPLVVQECKTDLFSLKGWVMIKAFIVLRSQ
jgi:hypothetical protein